MIHSAEGFLISTENLLTNAYITYSNSNEIRNHASMLYYVKRKKCSCLKNCENYEFQVLFHEYLRFRFEKSNT